MFTGLRINSDKMACLRRRLLHNILGYLSTRLKPLSVTNNSVGSGTAAAADVGAAVVAHVASSGRSRIDAVFCN